MYYDARFVVIYILSCCSRVFWLIQVYILVFSAIYNIYLRDFDDYYGSPVVERLDGALSLSA